MVEAADKQTSSKNKEGQPENDNGYESPGPKFEPVHTTFNEALKSVMQSNPTSDLVDGFELLSKLLNSADN